MTNDSLAPMQDPHPADRVFFAARLTPHRSLGRAGFLALMLATGAVCFVGGVLFLAVGAWPVFGFFGLDLLIVYVAFRWNYADARAYEDIAVAASEIVLTKVDRRGGTQVFRFNPAWVRLEVTRVSDEGTVAIALASHGRSVPVGAFLNPPDRESLAQALARAIGTARRGGPLVPAS